MITRGGAGAVNEGGGQLSKGAFGALGGGNDSDDAVVRLRGLPFHCSKDDITKFFAGMRGIPKTERTSLLLFISS